MDKYIPFILIPIIYWGIIQFLKKKNQYTALKKRTLIIGIVAFFITEMVRSFYRPYVYQNNINDFFFADTIGNSFGTITALFIILTMAGSGTNKDWGLFILIVAGLIFYEFLNLAGNVSFDINDIYATILFAAISSIVYSILLTKFGKSIE